MEIHQLKDFVAVDVECSEPFSHCSIARLQEFMHLATLLLIANATAPVFIAFQRNDVALRPDCGGLA